MPAKGDDISSRADVLVIGAGVIGLSIGWRAAQRGLRVLVVDAAEQPGRAASYAAAGMLAASNEAEYGEDLVQPLALASADAYPAFVQELVELTGIDPGYEATGTLQLALDADDAEALKRRFAFLERLGLDAEWLRGSECRALEPALSPRVRCGIRSHGDHQVDPRRLTEALVLALRSAGGELRTSTPVVAVEPRAAMLEDGTRIEAAQVVVAAGAWTSQLAGLPHAVTDALRPVKGQIVRLHGPRIATHVVWLPEIYITPRRTGELVVGATVEEQGFDERVTAGAVHELLRRAYEALPGVTELELVDTRASLRPGSRDNAPVLGSLDDGTIVATGHFRNGILLAPATADAIAELLANGRVPSAIAAFTPARFAAPGSRLEVHADHAQR
jgi:glycine oxidase